MYPVELYELNRVDIGGNSSADITIKTGDGGILGKPFIKCTANTDRTQSVFEWVENETLVYKRKGGNLMMDGMCRSLMDATCSKLGLRWREKNGAESETQVTLHIGYTGEYESHTNHSIKLVLGEGLKVDRAELHFVQCEYHYPTKPDSTLDYNKHTKSIPDCWLDYERALTDHFNGMHYEEVDRSLLEEWLKLTCGKSQHPDCVNDLGYDALRAGLGLWMGKEFGVEQSKEVFDKHHLTMRRILIHLKRNGFNAEEVKKKVEEELLMSGWLEVNYRDKNVKLEELPYNVDSLVGLKRLVMGKELDGDKG